MSMVRTFSTQFSRGRNANRGEKIILLLMFLTSVISCSEKRNKCDFVEDFQCRGDHILAMQGDSGVGFISLDKALHRSGFSYWYIDKKPYKWPYKKINFLSNESVGSALFYDSLGELTSYLCVDFSGCTFYRRTYNKGKIINDNGETIMVSEDSVADLRFTDTVKFSFVHAAPPNCIFYYNVKEYFNKAIINQICYAEFLGDSTGVVTLSKEYKNSGSYKWEIYGRLVDTVSNITEKDTITTSFQIQ